MVPFEQSAKNLKQKRYQLRNLRENSATKMVPLEKSTKNQKQKMIKIDQQKRYHSIEFSPNSYEKKSPLKRYHLGKRQSFVTKKVLLIKVSMKNHQQNWYHFSEEPKFGNKSGTILGNLPPICRKIVPVIRENSKSHTRNIF